MAGFYFHPWSLAWRNCDSGMLTLNLLNEDACQTIYIHADLLFIYPWRISFIPNFIIPLHAYHLKYSVSYCITLYIVATLLNN